MNALNRITDLQAFTAIARHVYVAVTDPEDPESYLFLRRKNRLLRKEANTGLRYELEEKEVAEGITALHIVWGKSVSMDADEVLKQESGDARRMSETAQRNSCLRKCLGKTW